MKTPAFEKVSKARVALLYSQPFFATLALNLRLEETDKFPTMAVDGTTLFFNAAFVLGLSMAELQGVIIHETLHCANKHHTRRGTREVRLWNVACDYAINRDILAAGFKLPAGGLFDPRFNGMGAEPIYSVLQKEQSGGGGQSQPQPGQQKPGGNPGAGQPAQGAQQPGQGAPGAGQPGAGQPGGPGDIDPGACGGVIDAAPAHDAAALERAAADWDAKVRQAVSVAKARGAGTLPGAVAEVVQTINDGARIDWRALLRRFVDESASRDFSFMRPNRRHVARGMYLPGYVPDRPAHIVAMVDTSGSMSQDDLAALVAELQGALDEGAADRLTMVFADTKVHAHEEFAPGDIIRANVKGRGGTAFAQPLAWLGENIPDASAILYMTDCDVTEWGQEPAAPLLWVVTGYPTRARAAAANAPFGEAIVLEE